MCKRTGVASVALIPNNCFSILPSADSTGESMATNWVAAHSAAPTRDSPPLPTPPGRMESIYFEWRGLRPRGRPSRRRPGWRHHPKILPPRLMPQLNPPANLVLSRVTSYASRRPLLRLHFARRDSSSLLISQLVLLSTQVLQLIRNSLCSAPEPNAVLSFWLP